jgi:hypothetical protein
MADVIFEDYSFEVQGAIDDNCNAVLEECAGELESAVKRNSRVDTGKTKNSFRHVVDTTFHEATVGSSDENAIWEEFGTGEYALNGDGRKGGWWYKNPKAKYTKTGKLRKGSKEFVFTHGKKPSRAFRNAFTKKKDKIIKRIQNSLKGM